MSNEKDYDRMIAGKFYNSVNPELLLLRTRARCLADRYSRSRAWNILYRNHIIKKLIPNHGNNFFFEPPIHLEYGKNIKFGDNFYMNFDCILLDVAPIEIGMDVMFGPRVVLATPMHPLDGEERKQQEYPDGFHDLEYAKPIKIGNGVWLASNVTVCGGVTIGDNTIIAAGSVVTRDIPANVIAAGSPCKVIRELDENDKMNPLNAYNNNEIPLSIKNKKKSQ